MKILREGYEDIKVISKHYSILLSEIAEQMRIAIPEQWSGLDVFVPFLEQIRQDGALAIFKIDGERVRPDDTGSYTAAAGFLDGDHTFHIDASSIEDALANVIIRYAHDAWRYNSTLEDVPWLRRKAK
ncbi:MAG: hypothetical protein PVS3B3_37860 [Ktedonobacteraceae bacterium]